MTKSAKLSKREATALAINTAALALADERGLDGFTMDTLAEAAGVSRRTLFNYFPGKIDAILGNPPEQNTDAMETFRAGGPTGNLMTDLKVLTLDVLASAEVGVQEFARFRRLLKSEPRILHAAHARFEQKSDLMVALIVERDAADGDSRRARIAVRLILTAFDLALDDFLEQPGEATLAEQFSRTFSTIQELLG